MRIPSPEFKRDPGEINRMVVDRAPKCERIISSLPCISPQASTTASAGNISRVPSCSIVSAADTVVVCYEFTGRAGIAEFDARLP